MNRFRASFPVVNRELLNWFPGHMGKGIKQMQQKLKQVDCVIEVHDARIPLSGRNSEFRYTISGVKPHVLVLNKKDTIERRSQRAILDRLQGEDSEARHVLFTNCKDQSCDGIRKVMPLAQDLILGSNRFNRADQKEYCIMIIGVPNVGAVAGITRSVLHKIKICEDPLVYLLDTPGILKPNIADTETGLRLALVSCLQDHLVGEELIADYLLYLLNKRNNFRYVEMMGLQEPTDSIAEVLVSGAQHLNRTLKVRNFDGSIVVRPDVTLAARHMIKSFRTGAFGKILIDSDKIE
ncbi:hypothetical protein quinque_015186 [Culex quinquefasciatus]